MIVPFLYPGSPHVRRHGPRGYADPASYRPWLRDEFEFRCVYCLLREQWGVLRGTFAVEHFLAAALHPELATQYDNLVYSCIRCNSAKGDSAVADPCQVLVQDSVRLLDDGTIEALTPAARRLVRVLGLNDPEPKEFRVLWRSIVRLAQNHDTALYRRLMGYPEDLPQLALLRPPGGNSRPDGIQQSSCACRQNGTLADTY